MKFHSYHCQSKYFRLDDIFLNIATQIDKISVRFETLEKKKKNNACFVSDLIDPM